MSEENKNATMQRRPNGPRPGGGPMALMPGEKAKDFKGSMKKLIGYLGRYKWTILFVLCLAVVSTVFMIVGPKVLGKATDELFTGIMNKIAGTGGIDFAKIGKIMLTLVGLYVISASFSYCRVL
jgi:ATP-binding cassette subfamily B protein